MKLWNIQRWEDCGRDDLAMIPKMIAAGWEPIFDYRDHRNGWITPQKIPHETVSFTKGIVHAWKGYKRTNEGIFSHWNVADLIDGHYHHHRQVNSLDELIKKEAI